MPSSTSNSNVGSRLPQCNMIRLWLLVLLVTVMAGGSMEIALRRKGHQPSLTDMGSLWAMQRMRVDHGDTSLQVAILGDSRAQMGLNPTVIQDKLPGHDAIMLAITGSNCLPVLEDLAFTTNFKGTVLCSFTASQCISRGATYDDWIDQYHSMFNSGAWVNTLLDQAIRTELQKSLAISSQQPFELFKSMLLMRGLPQPNFVTLRPSRYLPADYYLHGARWMDQCRNARIDALTRSIQELSDQVKDAHWDAMLIRLKAVVDHITSRGGRVVLVRMPTEAEHYEMTEKQFPRSRYWDMLAARVGATTIYFRDYPELSGFVCPDTSHLNFDDADRFTGALVDVLKKQGFFINL